jgi:hypothetical protein
VSRLPRNKRLSELQQKLGAKDYKIRNHYYCDDICEHPVVEHLMPFYKRVLCVTLQKAVEDNLSAPVTTQLSLLEELAITREIACEPLAEYSEIVNKIEKIQAILDELNGCDELNENDESEANKEVKKNRETLLKALDLSKQLKANTGAKAIKALETVRDFCEKAARIDALCRDKFSIHTLNSVVAQITNIISRKLHDNNLDHIALEVNDAIQKDLVIPLPETASGGDNSANASVKLTPDKVLQDLLDMDDMVPSNSNTDAVLNETDSE